MRQFLTSIQSSLDTQNWLAALSTTLTLPDMAGWAHYPDLGTGARYRRWFDDNIARYYASESGPVFLNSSDCWALRCSFLHSGQDDVSGERARRDLARFVFSVTGSHRIRVNNVLQLDVRRFCQEFIQATNEWLAQHGTEKSISSRLNTMLLVRTTAFEMWPGVRVQ